MLVVKRDGHRESVKFDKITARVEKLCYALDSKHVNPVEVAMKVINGHLYGIHMLGIQCVAELFNSGSNLVEFYGLAMSVTLNDQHFG